MAYIKGARLFYVVWGLGVTIVLVISYVCSSTGMNFSGIAEQREVFVNWESAVEIKRIHVIEGEPIDVGELLVELDSQELRLQINQISYQLEQLEAQKDIDRVKIQSEIDQLEARKNTIITEILNKIRQLENQYDINRSLTAGLQSIHAERASSHAIHPENPIAIQIESLEQELSTAISPLTIQIDHLLGMLSAAENPLESKIASLSEELALLKEQRGQLNIFAPISGIISSIRYKPGEKVSPFEPILSLHTKRPSLVKGYIYESVHTSVTVGSVVEVASAANRGNTVIGEIVGLGTRIVECPPRLRKYQEVITWGREVTIKIPRKNVFLLGEKVAITVPEEDRLSMLDALAQLIFPQQTLAKNDDGKEMAIHPASTLTSSMNP